MINKVLHKTNSLIFYLMVAFSLPLCYGAFQVIEGLGVRILLLGGGVIGGKRLV